MNSQQAKQVLLLYRPETPDEQDPDFLSALELVRRDPELQHWFEDHCTTQRLLRSRFQQITVPEGLKQQILSERKVTVTPSVPRRKAILLACAASIVLALLAVTAIFRNITTGDTFSEFRSRMARIVLREYPRMDLETNDLTQIRQFLAEHKGHGDYASPAGLNKAAGSGCAILTWRGQAVSMVCFNSGEKAGSSETNDLFLFVIDKAAVPSAPDGPTPRFTQLNKLATLSWSSGDKTYVLAGVGDERFIRKYL